METKKHNISAGKKGGRNPFGKVSFAIGGLAIGTVLAEAVDRWRTEHPNSPKENEAPEEEPITSEEEQVAENTETNQQPQEGGQEENDHETEGPQPIDPEDPERAETPEESVNSGESVDEAAERIASNDEIDPTDENFIAFMNVGEHRTFFTENGEVDVFDIELNDPNLSGYPFMLADIDGDGFYETILMADGTPANISVNAEPGEPDSLDYYLAQANISRSDLEEMHETDGGYLRPDDEGNVAQNDDPTGDMIDENGHNVGNEHVTQNDPPTSDEDDEDEIAYLALLHQLLDDDEEEEGEDDDFSSGTEVIEEEPADEEELSLDENDEDFDNDEC